MTMNEVIYKFSHNKTRKTFKLIHKSIFSIENKMLKRHLIHDPGQSKTSSPNETKKDVSIRSVGRYIPPAKLRFLQVR